MNAGARIYRFGGFELDVASRRLVLHGNPIRLERRPFDLLVLLVTRHGQLVERDEIVSSLWPGNTIIDFDAGLNTLVRKVRQALGDHSDSPQYIETVAGHGYRFIAPVLEISQLPVKVPDEVPKPDRRRVPLISSVIVFVAAAVVIVGVWLLEQRVSGTTSIAVLPFENLTGNADLGYLASGLAEETSASLTRIEPVNLRVIGSVSTAALAASSLSAAQIGQELGVEYVVKSSLHAQPPRIRVNASLTRVADNALIWSESFDRALLNVLGLQRELSTAIAEQIRLQLSPEVAAAIDRRQTTNPEAYRLYLKGRYAWGHFTPTSNRDALEYYRQAVKEDPDYALAWAGIAQALAVSPMTVDTDPGAVFASAREALAQAVRSGPDLAEVLYAQGYVSFFLDWNVPAAEAAARKAVQIDPNNAVAHFFLGVVLSQMNNHVEAREMLRRARELDPLFAQTFALSAMVANHAGDYQSGLEFAQQAIAITPQAWVGYLHLGIAQYALGDLDAALQTFSDAERLSGGNSMVAAYRAFVLTRIGRKEEATAILARLMKKTEQQYVSANAIAVIYAGLDDRDSAFDWLDRAIAARDVRMMGIEQDFPFEGLKSDPRFQRVLARIDESAR